MVVQLMDSVSGTAVYINPEYVVTRRTDPADSTRVTMVKLNEGEAFRVRGEHQEFADKLARKP